MLSRQAGWHYQRHRIWRFTPQGPPESCKGPQPHRGKSNLPTELLNQRFFSGKFWATSGSIQNFKLIQPDSDQRVKRQTNTPHVEANVIPKREFLKHIPKHCSSIQPCPGPVFLPSSKTAPWLLRLVVHDGAAECNSESMACQDWRGRPARTRMERRCFLWCDNPPLFTRETFCGNFFFGPPPPLRLGQMLIRQWG